MSNFDSFIADIGKGLADFSTLDVLTIKGNVTGVNLPADLTFENLVGAIKNNGNSFRIVALTQSKLDGDLNNYFDEHITPEEVTAHQKLCESADAKRAAVIQIFSNSILEALKK